MRRFSTMTVMVLAVLAVAAVSCARPDSVEQFVSVEDRGTDGLYRYALDMSDSLATYDVSFYTRIDAGKLKMAETEDFPLTVTWTAPSGRRYRETVYFDVFDEAEGSDFYSSQYCKPYRSGLAPVEWGVWDMTVQVNFGNDVQGLRGLGVICKKNLPDGTR